MHCVYVVELVVNNQAVRELALKTVGHLICLRVAVVVRAGSDRAGSKERVSAGAGELAHLILAQDRKGSRRDLVQIDAASQERLVHRRTRPDLQGEVAGRKTKIVERAGV